MFAVADFAVPALAGADFAVPVFAVPAFAVPDFAVPVFAVPALAVADFAGSLGPAPVAGATGAAAVTAAASGVAAVVGPLADDGLAVRARGTLADVVAGADWAALTSGGSSAERDLAVRRDPPERAGALRVVDVSAVLLVAASPPVPLAMAPPCTATGGVRRARSRGAVSEG
ncbi:MAG TPA: hypothetical protein VKB14_13555 [Actinomycetales bacterium]|nr:hypothetical protein [Actinomycetales bacterium]